MCKGVVWHLSCILNKKNITIIIIINIVISLLNLLFLRHHTSSDFYIFSFLGYGIGYFNQIEFFKLLINNIFPIYIMGVLMSMEHFGNNMILIRHKNLTLNFKSIQIAYCIFFILNVLIQFIVVLIISKIFSIKSVEYIYLNDFYNLNQFKMEYILISAIILKIVELMFTQMLFLSIYSINKNVTGSFLFVLFIYLILCFDVNHYIPIGISSIQRFINLDKNLFISFIKAFTTLTSTYVILYQYIRIKGYEHVYR